MSNITMTVKQLKNAGSNFGFGEVKEAKVVILDQEVVTSRNNNEYTSLTIKVNGNTRRIADFTIGALVVAKKDGKDVTLSDTITAAKLPDDQVVPFPAEMTISSKKTGEQQNGYDVWRSVWHDFDLDALIGGKSDNDDDEF